MDSANPTISELLSGHAHVLHTKRRLNLQKRIVELKGRKYVLYRFRFARTMRRFEDALGQIQQAGIAVQSICARTTTFGEYLRYGHWLALTYLPGQPLAKKPALSALAALGSTMARLNTLEGPQQQALFERKHPVLPHEAYLASEDRLTERQRQWVRQSLARLRTVSGTQLTHGDLFGDNIIEKPDGTVGLIDYELLAYDISGIELAGTLLRPFCRSTHNRRALVQSYLASCPPELKAVWNRHGRDLIFAAAARLALARQDRLRHMGRQQRISDVRRVFSFRKDQAVIDRQNKKHHDIIRSANRNNAYYRNVALAMIELCLKDSRVGPVAMLERSDRWHAKVIARAASARKRRLRAQQQG